jgi:hypothetical protein
MDARKLIAASDGRVVTSDAYSRTKIHLGSDGGRRNWTRLLRFNR